MSPVWPELQPAETDVSRCHGHGGVGTALALPRDRPGSGSHLGLGSAGLPGQVPHLSEPQFPVHGVWQ